MILTVQLAKLLNNTVHVDYINTHTSNNSNVSEEIYMTLFPRGCWVVQQNSQSKSGDTLCRFF